MTSPGRFYDEPFFNPKLSVSLADGLSEPSRKAQLFDQVCLCLRAHRQVCRRKDLLAYASVNYTVAAIAAVVTE